MKRLNLCLVSKESALGGAVAALDQNGFGFILVVDSENRLEGVLTDHDIRVAILNKVSLDQKLTCFQSKTPVVGFPKMSTDEALKLMKLNSLTYLPLVRSDGVVVDVILREDIEKPERIPIRAMIFAGGLGTRLHPITQHIPKPMVPMSNKPLLEHIIEHLMRFDIREFHIAVRYKKESIIDYFKDGSQWGVKIQYIHEDEPLGTGGALRALPDYEGNTIVINGDVLTNLNMHLLESFHMENRGDITVGVRQFEVHIPFGVVDIEGVEISKLVEKPKYYYFINAGVYMLSKRSFANLPGTTAFNMTDVIDNVILNSGKVVSFPICGYWNDIGNVADYERVKAEMESKTEHQSVVLK